MDRYFKITANDAGGNHKVIIKEINVFQAVDNVNMNVDFIAKVVECDERGQELSTGGKQCNLPVVIERAIGYYMVRIKTSKKLNHKPNSYQPEPHGFAPMYYDGSNFINYDELIWLEDEIEVKEHVL